MTLDNVTLDDVLDALSNSCNVTYDMMPGRNIYLFRASADSADKPKLLTKVFKLYYVQVSKIKEIESSSSSSSGGSSSSGTSSSSGSSGGLVTLSTSDTDDTDLENSAIVKAIEKILSERGKVSVDDRSNSLIVTDTEDRLKMIESAITQLDRPLNQVLINVLLIETFEDLDRDLGLIWGDTDGFFGTISGGSQDTNFPFFTGPVGGHSGTSFWDTAYNMFKNTGKQFNPSHDSGALATGTRDFTAFSITLQALESASKLKVLAKPKILVLDNHPALIKIATNAAIGTTTVTEAGGAGTSSTSIERSEIGTILRVTPLINTGDRVTMTVEPTFATVDQSAITVAATETGDPTVRTARTTMMINDGQTIALGGLLFSNQSNGNRKVPFFGNLPVVGKALFTNNTKSLQDRELILFVTPNIITNSSVLETLSVPEKRLQYEDESAPWWKVKQKQWYKEMKEGPEKDLDFDSYFNVRKKLIDTTLDTLDQTAKAPSKGKP
ncbi:MAG TPA: secretin N-terminal domain-containing protein [Candidatus Omnitrophota bacterium]|nr:secretin N-terminal domain-containing protein [Candidatus Omnitrophota bacterium]